MLVSYFSVKNFTIKKFYCFIWEFGNKYRWFLICYQDSLSLVIPNNKGFHISFENLHKLHKKCTPTQIMYYHQLTLNLHKTLNHDETDLNFEIITVLHQMVCTGRQIKFQIFRNSNCKIGFNTTANKFFRLNGVSGLDLLNLKGVHFKKIAKIQFLKNGKT